MDLEQQEQQQVHGGEERFSGSVWGGGRAASWAERGKQVILLTVTIDFSADWVDAEAQGKAEDCWVLNSIHAAWI